MAIRSPKWFVLAALVVAAPDAPGVFELWDDDELMYVGETRGERPSLRKELVHELLERDSPATHSSPSTCWSIGTRRASTLATRRPARSAGAGSAVRLPPQP